MHNPKWHPDEIILALDLYFSSNRGSISDTNHKFKALSSLLNSLELFYNVPEPEKFRNINAVSTKMANFQYFDERYPGKGLSGGSKLDKELFNRFVNHQDELRSIAVEIRKIASDKGLRMRIEKIETDDPAEVDEVWEGQALYKLHKQIERNRKIVKRKKKSVLKARGKLACEVCDIVFEEFYGEIGKGFIECHHRTPLASLKCETKTSLEDLALVCSNCHRMLHRRIDTLTIEALRRIIFATQSPRL